MFLSLCSGLSSTDALHTVCTYVHVIKLKIMRHRGEIHKNTTRHLRVQEHDIPCQTFWKAVTKIVSRRCGESGAHTDILAELTMCVKRITPEKD
jgi:hypothetical protein